MSGPESAESSNDDPDEESISPENVGLDAALAPINEFDPEPGLEVGPESETGQRSWRDHCAPREHCDPTDACDPLDACDLASNCDPGSCDCGSCDLGSCDFGPCLISLLLLPLRWLMAPAKSANRASPSAVLPSEYRPAPDARISTRVALTGLRFYKRYVSPHTGATCRFVPSCSGYAAQAIGLHGVRRGSRLARQRLRRCRPNGACGVDLVPGLAPGRVPGR